MENHGLGQILGHQNSKNHQFHVQQADNPQPAWSNPTEHDIMAQVYLIGGAMAL
jgi:hypothetical protein